MKRPWSASAILLLAAALPPTATAGPKSAPVAAPPSVAASHSPSWLWPALDAVVPGAGFFHHDRYVLAGTVALLRLGTAFAAHDYRVRSREYRSAQRSAQLADLYYGPGLRYRDPYSGDYLTSEEFGHRADRRLYVSGLALTVHFALLIWSSGYTYVLEAERLRGRTPIFELQPEEPKSQAGTERSGLLWRVGMSWRL